MRDYEFYYTQDGSIGLYSHQDNDVYHSKFGALTEAWEKFILPSGLDKKINNIPNIRVLDVCYGIGYNTKALMSYVINKNEKYLKQKSLIEKLKNFYAKNKEKNIIESINNDSIDSNNILFQKEMLLSHNETIQEDIISRIQIDCLDINEELVKISPLLKTIITPQEIFSRIIPRFLDCFDSYWKIKKFLARISFIFAQKNKKEISELLDLKFNNDYDQIESDYRIHKFVNYILLDELVSKYKKEYLDTKLKKTLSKRTKKKFFNKHMLDYAKFNQIRGYKLISKFDLCGYLHNIYYDHLSNRYKKARFNDAKKLFKVNFYVNDARKSILNLTGQYDYIYLDAFTFTKAPELWTVEFMAELYNRLSSRGVIITYSNSALVRNTFLENNLYVGKILNKKTGKFIGTIASKDKSMIEHPLTSYEIGLCNTRAGITYHDPSLNSTKEEILKRREIAFKSSELMTSSQYMRSRTTNKGDDNE